MTKLKLFDQLSDERTLREAWRKIHKNPRSAGIDEITIDEFRDRLETELDVLCDNLLKGKYKPQLLKGHPLEVAGENVASGHEKHSTVGKYSGLLFLGLRFMGEKIYPSGDSYVNAIWTVRRAANNRGLSLIRKLQSIEARIQGWCSAYAFTDFQEQQVAKLDKQLEDVMQKVLRKSDLQVIHKKTALEALQIETYKRRLNSINDKRNDKKAKK